MKNSSLSLSLADLSLKNVNRYKLLKNAKNKADTKNLERLRLPHCSFFVVGVVVDRTINLLSHANVCEFQVKTKIPCRSKALAFCQ